MFEKALRLQLRFNTPIGLLSAEDVWNLPLTSVRGRASLDSLAKNVHRQLREAEEESFVTPSRKDEALQLRFDIVKHVIDVRMKEAEERIQAQAKAEKKERIMEILKHKEDESLMEKDPAELEALLNAL